MSLSLTKDEIKFLKENLPVGWADKGAEQFAGKVSRSAIARTKLGQVQRPNPDVVAFLFRLARTNQEKMKRARGHLSAQNVRA